MLSRSEASPGRPFAAAQGDSSEGVALMAKIVLGLGSSHGPQLALTPDLWHRRAEADRANSELWYRGQTYAFPDLVEERGPNTFAHELAPEKATAPFEP